MSQTALIVLMFKIVLTADLISSLLWVAVYTFLARWQRNPIGKSITIMALLLAAITVPSLLSLYFHLNRQTSLVTGWVDVAIFAGIAATMFARTPMWIRMSTTDGERSYRNWREFGADVWRRRGRPVWKDRQSSDGDEGT